MLNPEEKIKKFTAAIEVVAQTESERIIGEVQREMESAMLAAEDEVLNEAFRYVKHQVAQERTETGRRVSRHMMERKNQINARREEMAAQVMGMVRDRLAGYVKTDGYYKQLLEFARAGIAALGGSEVILSLRPDDMPLAARLTEDLLKLKPGGKSGAVKIDIKEGSFEMGGLMVICPSTHMQVDETFDIKFEELRGRFAELFGLQLSQ